MWARTHLLAKAIDVVRAVVFGAIGLVALWVLQPVLLALVGEQTDVNVNVAVTYGGGVTVYGIVVTVAFTQRSRRASRAEGRNRALVSDVEAAHREAKMSEDRIRHAERSLSEAREDNVRLRDDLRGPRRRAQDESRLGDDP